MQSSFFSFELCLRIEPGSTLLPDVRMLLEGQPAKSSLQGKWELAKSVSNLLLASLPAAERGCWEYFDDEERAKSLWADWSKVVETKSGARTSPSGPVDPYRGEPRYMTVTMAFLLVRDAPTDLQLREACNVAQSLLWQRSTFLRILEAVPTMSFASVRADTLYMIPGDDEWGLTAGDLADEKFAYLRTITG